MDVQFCQFAASGRLAKEFRNINTYCNSMGRSNYMAVDPHTSVFCLASNQLTPLGMHTLHRNINTNCDHSGKPNYVPDDSHTSVFSLASNGLHV